MLYPQHSKQCAFIASSGEAFEYPASASNSEEYFLGLKPSERGSLFAPSSECLSIRRGDISPFFLAVIVVTFGWGKAGRLVINTVAESHS